MHVLFQEYRSVSNRIELNQIVSNGIESRLKRIESILNRYGVDIELMLIVLNFNTLH